MPNGSYWVGRGGFNYKRSGGGGNHRIFSLGAICNQPQDVNNTYVVGAGVGASSIATRRAKMLHSTINTPQYPYNRMFNRIGLQMSGGSNDYAYNWYFNDVYPNPYPSPRTPNCSGISGSLNKIINSISGTGSQFGSAVSWSPDMTKLAIGAPIYPSADDEGIVYICNADGTLIRSIQVANQGLSGQFGTNLAWSPDGTKLAVGSPYYSNSNGYGRVYIYDPNTGALIHTIISPLGTTTPNSFFGSSLAWSPDSSLLAIGMRSVFLGASKTGRVYIYDNNYTLPVNSIDSPTSGVTNFGLSLSWSNGGTKLAIGAYLNSPGLGFIYVYNPYTLAQINTIFASNVTSSLSLASNIAWSPDDSQIAVGEPGKNLVLLLNPNTGAVVKTINNPSSQSSKFGSSLSWSKCSAYGLYSSQLAIGAETFNSSAGIVYIYS
jgi:hypothetical protein